ncbi:hypothetical protein S245_072112, partial [Arachis hypogaea]
LDSLDCKTLYGTIKEDITTNFVLFKVLLVLSLYKCDWKGIRKKGFVGYITERTNSTDSNGFMFKNCNEDLGNLMLEFFSTTQIWPTLFNPLVGTHRIALNM